MTPKTIIFAGGGSLGHVMPGVAVWEAIAAKDSSITPLFVCAPRQEEKEFLTTRGLRFTAMHAGKFPRGISVRLITFPFLFAVSIIRSALLMLREKPAAVFSKGGFVSVPVCLAAKAFGVPVVLHESDSVTGMGNGLIAKMAKTVCVGFPTEGVSGFKFQVSGSQTQNHVFTGNPVRPEILQGSRDEALRLTGFSGSRPVLMVTGGSQGSVALNEAVVASISPLLDIADIVHLTGKGKPGATSRGGYWNKEYVFDELKHLYALADVVVTRAGAGALSELSALAKPVIVVPLRGVAGDHQWTNGQALAAKHAAVLLPQEELPRLADEVKKLMTDAAPRSGLGRNLQAFFPQDAATRIAGAVLDAAGIKE